MQGSGNITVEKGFEFEFWTCNRLPYVCNRLLATKLLKFKFKSHDLSKYNYVIDYQWRNSGKAFLKKHISSNHFKNAWRAYIYVCVWLQKKWKRYSKRTSLPNALSKKLFDKHLQIH